VAFIATRSTTTGWSRISKRCSYDNALLVRAYLDAWQRTRDPLFARVVSETLDFIGAEMTSPEGGFYSSLDADSEGEEGRFYVWTPAELREALGAADAARLGEAFDVTDGGNFDGRNILHPVQPAAAEILDATRQRLRASRSGRIRPHRDEKVLAGWNGLMLRAVADAARVLDRADLAQTAIRNARFLLDRMRRGAPDASQLQRWSRDLAGLPGGPGVSCRRPLERLCPDAGTRVARRCPGGRRGNGGVLLGCRAGNVL